LVTVENIFLAANSTVARSLEKLGSTMRGPNRLPFPPPPQFSGAPGSSRQSRGGGHRLLFNVAPVVIAVLLGRL
jgi:hypothetical protein